MPFEILFRDESLIAINKPHGLLVHRTKMAADAKEFALQLLRDLIGKPVYPAHRLDRKTSGVLLFALSPDMNRQLQMLFEAREMTKVYWAIVRGHTDDEGTIDYPLINESGKKQEALTKYKTLLRTELNVPFGAHETSRYSMVEIMPETGRMHQIRKHFAHIFHPIIADRTHGCNKQNRLFKEKWQMETMLLHARELSFEHPETSQQVEISANVQTEFDRMLKMMGWSI